MFEKLPEKSVEHTDSEDVKVSLSHDFEGKTTEELRTLQRQAYKLQEQQPDQADQLTDYIADIDYAIGNMPKAEEPEEKDDRDLAKEEILASINYPVEEIPDEALTDHGNYLIKQMNYARLVDDKDLVGVLNQRLQAVKSEAALLDREEAKEQPTKKAEPQSKPPKTIFVGRESVEDLDIPPQSFIDAVTEDMSAEEAEVVEEEVKKNWLQIARQKVFGDMTAKEIAKNMAVGAAVGASVKVAFRAALGLSGGAAVGAMTGATAGVIKKVGGAAWRDRQFSRLENKFIYEEDKEKVGEIYEQLKSGKISKVDALTLIANRKDQLAALDPEDPQDDDRFDTAQDLLELEGMLIKNQDELAKLKSGDKLQKYMELTSSSAWSPELAKRRNELETAALEDIGVKNGALIDEAVRLKNERREEVAHLAEDLDYAAGRKVTKEQVARAALTGAIGGAVGATAAHFIGGVWDSHFGHHAEVAASHAVKHTAGAVRAAPKMPAPDTAVVDSAPLPVPPSPDSVHVAIAAEVPHDSATHAVTSNASPEAPSQPETLQVKGTVWSTVKNFFKSKGIDATNDDINTATRFLAHENHIGIAADHPASGSYDVLDTKVSDGMELKGIEHLADMKHIPHVSAEHGIPDLPKVPDIYIEPIHSPYDIAHSLGFEPTDYNPMDASHHTVGEAVNWISNASEGGGKVEGAMRIFNMKPSPAEMHMSIDEFLKHRYVPSNAEMSARLTHDISESTRNFNIAEHHAHAATGAAHKAVQHVSGDLPHLEGGDIESSLSERGSSIPTDLEGFYEEGRLTPGLGPDAASVWNMTPAPKVPKSVGEQSMVDWLLAGLGLGVEVAGGVALGLGMNEVHKRRKAKRAPAAQVEPAEESFAGSEAEPEAPEAEEPKVESKPEAHNFRFGELELLIKEKLPNGVKVERLAFIPTAKGVRLDGELNAGMMGGKAKISGQLENKEDSIAIANLKVEARSYAKPTIEAAVNGLMPAIKKHFEDLYKKPISKIEVTETGLVVTTA